MPTCLPYDSETKDPSIFYERLMIRAASSWNCCWVLQAGTKNKRAINRFSEDNLFLQDAKPYWGFHLYRGNKRCPNKTTVTHLIRQTKGNFRAQTFVSPYSLRCKSLIAITRSKSRHEGKTPFHDRKITCFDLKLLKPFHVKTRNTWESVLSGRVFLTVQKMTRKAI